MITLCIQCHNFQRRLCWMLSSLVEQTCKNFAIDVAFYVGNGVPKTIELIDHFRRLDIRILRRQYTDFGRFERRGLTRNDQLRECISPWVWFCDSDHVYHPEYIERLLAELDRLIDQDRLITAGRMSTPVNCTNVLIDRTVGTKPIYIARAFEQAERLEPKNKRRACGAGHTQIVRVASLHEKVYVGEDCCRDWRWSSRIQKARSDMQFRKLCGGRISLPQWFSVNQIHLNHLRDNQVGYHLECQR